MSKLWTLQSCPKHLISLEWVMKNITCIWGCVRRFVQSSLSALICSFILALIFLSSPEAFSQDIQVGGAPLLPEFEEDVEGLFPENTSTDPTEKTPYIPFIQNVIEQKSPSLNILQSSPPQSQTKPQAASNFPLTVETVEQNSLQTLESQTLLGPLNESNGGVSPFAWRGSSQTAIATLLKHVTGRLQSRALRYELETLLMSSVLLPDGFQKTSNKSLGDYRRALLKTMGAQTALANLFQLESSLQKENLTTVGAQISPLLSTGNMEAVCPVEKAIHSLTLPPKVAARWRAVKVLCHLSQNNFDTAEIAYDLLLSQGFQDTVTTFYIDYAFGYIRLNEAQAHTALKNVEKLSDLQSAAAILSKGPVPETLAPKAEDWASGQSVLLAAKFASWDKIGDKRRVLAAEQALENGVLTTAQVQLLFAEDMKGDRDYPSDRRLHPSKNPEDRAALYRQFISLENTDSTRAQIEKIDLLMRGIKAAPSPLSANVFAQHLDPINDRLIVNPKIMKRTKLDQQDLIAEGLFTSLVSLDYERADAWLDLANATGWNSRLRHLWPLVVLSKSLKTGHDVELVDNELNLWLQSTPRNKETIHLLLNAFQKPPSQSSHLKDTETWPYADPARHAELILQASLLFEETHPSGVAPAIVANLIRAFISIGRGKTAQLLAIEVMSNLI